MGKHEQNMSCCYCCLFMRVCGLDIPDLLACCIDVFCGNRIREDLFQKGWWNGLPQLCKHLSMKVCGLDIPDLCVVLIVLESCS